jgi:hypothetical protein
VADSNRSSSEILLANAFTNNTFSLKETEIAIKSSVENSFNYLKDLQKSYVDISKFSKTENDICLTSEGSPFISLDKDFMDVTKRKLYKTSKFYNTLISLTDIVSNPDIFLYVPLIFIDGQYLDSYKIRCSLDAHTEIYFTHIPSMQSFCLTNHTIDIVFLKKSRYVNLEVTKTKLNNVNWTLSESILHTTFKDNESAFVILRGTRNAYGSNVFPVEIVNNTIVIDKDNGAISSILDTNQNVMITILLIQDIHKISGRKPVQKRIDNNVSSSIFTIFRDGNVYPMPIATDNILVLKYNTEDNTIEYENSDIVMHYPNIYEILSNEDNGKYEYEIYYIYNEPNDYFKYNNQFKYIHNYFIRKTDSNNLEEAICKLLYTTLDNSYLQLYFFSIFDYEDADYIYNHGDFFNTCKPYDFDYKVGKLEELIEYDLDILKSYGKNVCTPFQSYFLSTENINLEKRIRTNNYNEVDKDVDKRIFSTPMYLFTFRNDSNIDLDLRLYVDGYLIMDSFQMNCNNMEYIYIPIHYVTTRSYIEIEKFNRYLFQQDITFTSVNESITIDFPAKTEIAPTLYDFFITTDGFTRVDRKNFKIYSVVDENSFDVSDDLKQRAVNAIMSESIIDEGSDETWVSVDAFSVDDKKTERMDVKYLVLKKIKIVCTDDVVVGVPLKLHISKVPYMTTATMPKKCVPHLKIFNNRIPWRNDYSYVRTFINGKFIPIKFDVYSYDNETVYFNGRCYLDEGDTVAIDITPYSYEVEYQLDELPEDYTIDFGTHLSKPLDLAYYDIYLNGRKLNETNFSHITPTKIRIYNVLSRKNLLIYRRDRDTEFYGFTETGETHIDDILNCDDISDDDKESIIVDIIGEHEWGKDTDEDVNDLIDKVPSKATFDMYRFYLDIIIPRGITRASDFYIDKSLVETVYNEIYNRYSNKNDRVVMRPNVNCEKAETVLMIGKSYYKAFNDKLNSLIDLMGNPNKLSYVETDGDVIDAIIKMQARLGGLRLYCDENSKTVKATYEFSYENSTID